ncbi:hypothetical protein ACHWQZ_G018954 [Mnemiopsis leidyi]
MFISFSFCGAVLLVGAVVAETEWPLRFTGKTSENGIYAFNEETAFSLDFYGGNASTLSLESSCKNNESGEVYLNVVLYNIETSESLLSDEIKCSGDASSAYTNPRVHRDKYNIRIIGQPGVEFDVKVYLELTDIKLEDGEGEIFVAVNDRSHAVKSIYLDDNQIEATGKWSYVQVSAESNDTFLDDPSKNVDLNTLDDSWTHGCGPGGIDTSPRNVGKLIVTQNEEDLNRFFENPNAILDKSVKLSFSCFGMITISDASSPPLKSGLWLIGVSLDHSQNRTNPKNVKIRVAIEKDYQYTERILILFAVSFIGLIIPFLARIIFDAGNVDGFKKVEFKTWLGVVRDWFWRGNKGMTYLVALLAALLVVSAYQVVHARHYAMMKTGDRDMCYYNEKCYRPYGDIYDVSVNGIASNLPFMIHGVLLILYFSFAESYCRANNHKHYDYSLPYSFGFAFICEGFGSLIYHICPSQIIFQFDTLFMFVISLLMITAIYEGISIRDHDVRYSRIADQETFRPAKVFAFFIGPVYFFNFIGNLNATSGLPTKFMIPFYVLFGLWWVGILGWLAYKNSLLPSCLNPKDLPELDPLDGVDADSAVRSKIVEWGIKHKTAIKAVGMVLYSAIVVVGFVFALLQKVAFSLFILGVLIIALVILAVLNFVPVASVVVRHFHNIQLTKTSAESLNISWCFLV